MNRSSFFNSADNRLEQIRVIKYLDKISELI